MATIQIWGGGPYHPTRAQADVLAEQLRPLGHDVRYGADRRVFEPQRLRQADLLLMMGLDWSGVTKVDPGVWVEPQPIPERYEPLSGEHLGAIREHLQAGKPLLCHHSAILSFDERPELTEVFDGRWIDGRSSHPPYQEFTVRVASGEHPITQGVSDFEITDEIYKDLVEPARSQVLLQTEYEGRAWPLAWAGNHGRAKVACCMLGHDMGSYGSPELPQLLLNTIHWLLEPRT